MDGGKTGGNEGGEASGHFQYHSIKPALYFGYQVLHTGPVPVLIAEPEKALLEYLHQVKLK